MIEPRARRLRIDVLLVERGLAPTRAKAQALVMAGVVATKSGRIDKAGTLVADGLTYGISWNWAIGNGLIGLIAGLVPAAGLASRARWRRIGAMTVMGALGIIVGIGFAALTDVLVANLTPDTAIGVEWISVAKWELAWGVPLTIIVLLAWPRRPKIGG